MHDERESTMLEENSKQFPVDGSSEEDDEEEDEEENEDDENNSEAMHWENNQIVAIQNNGPYYKPFCIKNAELCC